MTQAVDFRFELLFLLFVLASLICLIAAATLGIRKRPAAVRLLKTLGIGWLAYLSLVSLVAAITPQRIVPMDRDLCFDEMCFAVVGVQTASQLGAMNQPARANGTFYIVTVRASSRARGRPQSEAGLHALLWSARREYRISPAGQSAWNATHAENSGLSVRLQAGRRVLSSQVFDVEAAAEDLGLVLSNGFTPGYFVIGECPLFHKPTVLQLSR